MFQKDPDNEEEQISDSEFFEKGGSIAMLFQYNLKYLSVNLITHSRFTPRVMNNLTSYLSFISRSSKKLELSYFQ